jgi:amino acid transporter
MYGIPFILLGNLAGNSIACGRYVMLAAGYSDAAGRHTASKGAVIGIAIAALSMVILVHMCTRRGGIFLNNVFAVLKVMLLLFIIVVGFAFRGDGLPQKDHIGGQNFSSPTSFADRSRNWSSYTESLLVVMYSYSGYEQPFYVSPGRVADFHVLTYRDLERGVQTEEDVCQDRHHNHALHHTSLHARQRCLRTPPSTVPRCEC